VDIEDWARWKSALVSRAHHNGQWRCGANVSVSEVLLEVGNRRFVAGSDHTKSTESSWQLSGGEELMLFTAEVAIVFSSRGLKLCRISRFWSRTSIESMPEIVVGPAGTLIAYESASVGVSAPWTMDSPEPLMLFMEKTAMPFCTALAASR
jgi:hypothetical protein